MLLDIEGVSKSYLPPRGLLRSLVKGAAKQPVHALQDVTMGVAEGEVVGLIGPNGAGKTTLIRIVSALLEQSRGHVRIAGFDTMTSPAEAQRRLGLMLDGDQGLYQRLTGRQNLEFFGAMYGLDASRARRRAAELLDLVGLAGRDKLVFGYSAGMRARLSLGRALLGDAPLLLLDEPTRSLDPVASQAVSDLLRHLSGQGKGVLVCTHRLDEVASTCHRVVALVSGRVSWQRRLEAGGAGPRTEDLLAGLLQEEATEAERS